MKTIKKLLISICFMFLFIILTTIKSNASSNLHLNKLAFDANINSDGSMDVIETWDIKIKDTNTLFKTFKTDISKYSDITNVQVSEITNGSTRNFTKINTLMYHVTKDSYYGMINDDGNFEIAWGVGLDDSSSTKKYKISYTVEDAITKYSDYAELYWQFVGSDFEVSADKITGTITLPSQAQSKDDIKVWGHTEDLNGEIYVTDLDEISFELDGFNSGRYVEIRTLFPTSMIVSTSRIHDVDILNDVIEEETLWANEANARRARRDATNFLITLVVIIVCILLSVFSILRAIKQANKFKGKSKYRPTQELEYYRDLPRKNATPAQSLYVYFETKSGIADNDIGKVVSATLLNLNLKKHLEFQVEKEKNKEKITIKILNTDTSDLSADEKVIFEFLQKACKDSNEITVKDFEKYIKRTSTTDILALKTNINGQTKRELINQQIYDPEQEKVYKKQSSQTTIYAIIIFFAIFAIAFTSEFLNVFGYIGIFGLIVCQVIAIVINSKTLNKINVYTQKGIDEKEMWRGLKKYMEDFSMLDKREVPEIAIWEHFLVFATAFGIADKVLKQLKVVYPNIENDLNVNTYTCMYFMMNTNFSRSFSNAISTSMSSAYSSASGGGGGFSGGGGGGRWPEVGEEVDKPSLLSFFEIFVKTIDLELTLRDII